MRRLCGERGYSVFEMVAVCVILGIVMTGITTVFVNGSRAELSNNYRFQAQQSARMGLDQLRLDVRKACAANVLSGGSKLVLAYVPNAGAGTPAAPDPTQCGAVTNNAVFNKTIFCALTSPTLSTAYALYRSTQLDSAFTCTAATGKLIADRLITNVVFGTTSPIPVGQFQTVNVTLAVTYKQQTLGAPYTLSQPISVRNSVKQTAGATTSCPNTVSNSTCTFGLCSTGTCYPPVIK
jgi:type II secretory pathway pseudopilin PulG